MSVTLDANANLVGANTVQTVSSALVTVGSGANRALIVQISFSVAVSALGITWDAGGSNQAMTLIGTSAGVGLENAQLWGLVNPVSGNKTLTATWTTNANVRWNATSFAGVEQSGGTRSFSNATATTGTTGNPSVTVPSGLGNIALDCVILAAITLSAPTQTNLFTGTAFGCSYALGAASLTFGWTSTPGVADWAQVGCNLVAAIPPLGPLVSPYNDHRLRM